MGKGEAPGVFDSVPSAVGVAVPWHVIEDGSGCGAEVDKATELAFEPRPLCWRCPEKRYAVERTDALVRYEVKPEPTPFGLDAPASLGGFDCHRLGLAHEHTTEAEP